MANRRMFSKNITQSSSFLMMPPTSRLFYYDLGMNADDDGFCEYFGVMKMTDATPDDLRVLSARGFVKVFDDKVLVIRDWRENNYLRSDRYAPSRYAKVYKGEFKKIAQVKDNAGIPVVYQKLAQGSVGKDRIGKDNIDKNKRERETPTTTLIKFSSKEEMKGEVFTELAEKYNVPVDFVIDCWDSAKNWLDSKGTTRKDYRAFLANWVKRDAAKVRLEFKKGVKNDRRGIDARGIE